MTGPNKYIFDRSFDDLGRIAHDELPSSSVESVELTGPNLTQADVELARSEGYRQGLMAGSQASKEALEHHIASILETIRHTLNTMTYDLEQQSLKSGEALCLLIKRLFPHFSQSLAFEEVAAFIEDHCRNTMSGTKMTIKVAPTLVEPLQKRLQAIDKQMISLVPDETLMVGDCKMNWDWGGADRNTKSAVEEFLTTVQHILPNSSVIHEKASEDEKGLNDA